MRAAAALLLIAAPLAVIAARPRGPLTVEDVVARYAAAVGGRDVLAKISSRVVQLSTSAWDQPAAVTITSKAPANYLEVIDIPALGETIRRGFDGKVAWSQSDGAVRILKGAGREELIDRAAAANYTELFAERWPTSVTLLPEQVRAGNRFIALRIEPDGARPRELLLDAATYRPAIVLRRWGGGEASVEATATAKGPLGEAFARQTTMTDSAGNRAVSATVTSIQDNVSVDDAIFSPPHQGK